MITYSIIIPNRNNHELLNRLLNSIPIREDIQIIIVDDQSDVSYINEYPGMLRSNVKIIFCKERKGAGAARNIGIKNASGKWLLFADSDDFYNSNAFNVLDKHKNEDVDIFFFNVNSVDSISLKKSTRDKNYGKYINMFLKGKDNNAEYIRFRKWEPWFKMFKRDFVINNKLQYEEIPRCNDMAFNLKASYLAKTFGATMEKLYCVTTNLNSITKTKISKEVFWVCIQSEMKKNYLYRIINHKMWQSTYLYIVLCLIKNNGLFETVDFMIMLFKRRKELLFYRNNLYKFFQR